MSPHSLLFSPLQIGGLSLENRIVISPMCQYSAQEGLVQPWHFIHYGTLGLSGAGLVILEATAVAPEGRITHGCLGLYSDAQEAAFRDLLASLKANTPARYGLQLGHAGRRASARTIFDRNKGESLPPEEGAWQTLAPSALPVAEGWHTPSAMTEAQILDLIAAFADSARRADRAGFDLIEIHAAHGYLLHQFLSPLTNLRQDDWGGDQTRRNRLILQIAKAVRAVWPKSKALGIRLTSTDWHKDGFTLTEAADLARQLKQIGLDYAVMSAGNLTPEVQIPPASPGHQVAFAAEIRAKADLPSMAVGVILNGPQAEAILQAGQADLIAIARAVLDDPRWGWHAAADLGVDIPYPPQYLRVRPNNWIGYPLCHPQAQPVPSARQADRPATALYDRPPAK